MSAQIPTDSWFAGFGDASARKGGSYINAGVYRIRVEALTRQLSQNPKTRGHQLFIGELSILEVITAYEAAEEYPASNRAGERVSYIQNATLHGETALGNAKGLLVACVGAKLAPAPFNENDYTPQQWQAAILAATNPPGNMFAGVELIARASRTRTKAGKPFTPVRFEPAP